MLFALANPCNEPRQEDDVPAPSSRLERRHAETRDEILRAARDLVVEKGARNVSLREVGRRIDLSAPALYRYFPGGRDEVMAELARHGLETLGRHLRRVPATLAVDERLIELGMAYLAFAHEHAGELALMFDSLSALGTLDVEEGAEMFGATSLFQLIDEVVRQGVAQGVLHARDEDDVALMWHGAWALLHGMAFVEQTHQHHDELFDERGRDVLRIFVNGLKTEWTR
jgi:AcrR family transcriptional regulator